MKKVIITYDGIFVDTELGDACFAEAILMLNRALDELYDECGMSEEKAIAISHLLEESGFLWEEEEEIG